MAKHREGYCQICGQEHDAYVSAYQDHPFIDGRCYLEICWVCANVPRTWELLQCYDDGFCVHNEYVMVYDTFDPKRLFTVKEMMEDGFTKVEAERSIKAVKSAIKRGKPGSDLIRHCICFPPGCGTKPPSEPPPTQVSEEDEMSRKHRRKKKKNKDKDANKEQRPILVREVTIREIR